MSAQRVIELVLLSYRSKAVLAAIDIDSDMRQTDKKNTDG